MQLVQQIGADVAGTDDRRGDLRSWATPARAAESWNVQADVAERAEVGRGTRRRRGRRSRGCTSPGRITCPACSRTPNEATLRASQATEVTGLPSTASDRPTPTSSSLRSSAHRNGGAGPPRPGLTRAAPSTNPAEDALSAMVSGSAMRQSTMRLSMSSSAAVTASVAASTSSSVQPSPGRSAPRMNADLWLDPRDQVAGDVHGGVLASCHVAEQVAVVGLVHAHHLLHRLRRQARPCGRRRWRRRRAAG